MISPDELAVAQHVRAAVTDLADEEHAIDETMVATVAVVPMPRLERSILAAPKMRSAGVLDGLNTRRRAKGVPIGPWEADRTRMTFS